MVRRAVKRITAVVLVCALSALFALGMAPAQAETPKGTSAVVRPTEKPPAPPVAHPPTTPQQPTPTPETTKAEPSKVKVGMFVTQLYDLDMAKRSFAVTFWGWYQTPDDKYKPIDSAEIVNAKSFATKFSSVDIKKDVAWDAKKSDIAWTQAKYNAIIAQDWDVKNFPFDRQVLNIYIEDATNDESQTKFIADAQNSKLDDEIRVPGWTITTFNIHAEDNTYETTYGDPTLQGTSTYSRIVASISIKRDGIRLLGSMFIGFFVAFILVLLTYCMDANEMAGSRIGLSAGAIFAAVGNKYVVDNYLPPASTFTLSDGIELAIFLAIIFGIVVIVIIQRFRTEHPIATKLFNTGSALFSVVSYFGFIGYLILRAVW